MKSKDNRQINNNNCYQDSLKHTLKIVITSVICTLLFVIIVLLLVLFGLKKCSSNNNNQSNNDSSIKYNYDNIKLNDVFKKIVFNQVYVDVGIEEEIDEIVAIIYIDDGSSFSLNIDALIGDNLYYYYANEVSYSNHETFVSYLLTLNLETNIPLLEGSDYGVNQLPVSLDRLTNEKDNSRYIIVNAASNKYISGYYFEDNKYYIYQKEELVNLDSFPAISSEIIDINSPLYGYYQELNEGVI